MNRYLALVFLVLSTAWLSASAGQNASDNKIVWQYVKTHHYEPEHPGLGKSSRYRSTVGWIDVYTYDLRRKWKAGVIDLQFTEHFNETIEEVREYARRGKYVDLRIGSPRDVDIAGHTFRTIEFSYLNDGSLMRSITYLTATGGVLLKYRISIVTASSLDIDTVARKFIQQDIQQSPKLR